MNDSFLFAAGGMERAQLFFKLSFNIALANERVSLFAVLCAAAAVSKYDSSL